MTERVPLPRPPQCVEGKAHHWKIAEQPGENGLYPGTCRNCHVTWDHEGTFAWSNWADDPATSLNAKDYRDPWAKKPIKFGVTWSDNIAR
jgi:hypothetical protein